MKNKCKHAEDIAMKYLFKLGYSMDDFLLSSWNPDFVTRDGKRWEVKRISKNGKIIFTYNQVHEYDKKIDVIGVYENDVIFIKNYTELKPYIENCVLDTTKIFSLLVDYEQEYIIRERIKENKLLIEKFNKIII